MRAKIVLAVITVLGIFGFIAGFGSYGMQFMINHVTDLLMIGVCCFFLFRKST